MLDTFQLAGGSVAGRDHRQIKGVPRNRQDDFCIQRSPAAITALVADGCGSGRQSEVGAQLAIRLLSTSLHRLAATDKGSGYVLAQARQDLLAKLHLLARDMGPSYSEAVLNCFLFTLLGVLITPDWATFFALGDGVFIINDDCVVLEPNERNQPIYLGYALTGSSLTDGHPELLEFQLVHQLPIAELDHFVIGSDGLNDFLRNADRQLPGLDKPVGDISQFWSTDRYFKNPVAIERQLNLAARDWPKKQPDGSEVIEHGLLPDDTTLVVGRQTTPDQPA